MTQPTEQRTAIDPLVYAEATIRECLAVQTHLRADNLRLSQENAELRRRLDEEIASIRAELAGAAEPETKD